MTHNGHWLSRSILTYNYHAKQLKENPNWTLRATARTLKRSLGSVSEDMLLASWSKTHRPQLERFETAKEALEFVRERKRKQLEDEIGN